MFLPGDSLTPSALRFGMGGGGGDERRGRAWGQHLLEMCLPGDSLTPSALRFGMGGGGVMGGGGRESLGPTSTGDVPSR